MFTIPDTKTLKHGQIKKKKTLHLFQMNRAAHSPFSSMSQSITSAQTQVEGPHLVAPGVIIGLQGECVHKVLAPRGLPFFSKRREKIKNNSVSFVIRNVKNGE